MMATWLGKGRARGLLLAALRLVRALCLLSAPLLLTDLVVFGLVCQGARSAVPALVRAESLARYELALDDAQAELVEACYARPNDSGVRVFAGPPSQLHTFSPLSMAFCSCAGGRGPWGIAQGMRLVREEYAGLGLSQSSFRDAYVARSLRDVASCALACAAACLAIGRLERDDELRAPSPASAAVEHLLKVG